LIRGNYIYNLALHLYTPSKQTWFNKCKKENAWSFTALDLKELQQRLRRRQQERQKINRATSLQAHHEFCAFLCRRCKTTTCFMKDVNTRKRFNFSFSELRYSLSTPEKLANIWHFWLEKEREGIRSTLPPWWRPAVRQTIK